MEKTEYKIYDNFLDKKDYSTIRDVLEAPAFPWYYQPNVTHADQSEYDNRNFFYFTHLFFDRALPKSDKLSTLLPLINAIKAKALIRVKANLYPNFNTNELDAPHVDYEYPHKAAILYLNNNNGPTVLEDGTEIECKENRLVLFDGSKPHDSKYCTDADYRLNINLNFF